MMDGTKTHATEPMLLDEREAAKRLRISPRGLWQLRANREIAFVRIGARILYRPRDLEAFCERQTQAAVAGPAATPERISRENLK